MYSKRRIMKRATFVNYFIKFQCDIGQNGAINIKYNNKTRNRIITIPMNTGVGKIMKVKIIFIKG